MSNPTSPLLRSFLVGALLALAACSKPTPPPPPPQPKVEAPKPVLVPVAKETERSRHFLAVHRHLELGGPIYGYVELDGDALKAASGLKSIFEQIAKGNPALAPVSKLDFAALVTTLGMTDVKAFGLSSVPAGSGLFRNRAFLYAPGERHGLLAAFGGQPGPLRHLALAPANTSFYTEAELDLAVVYRTIKEIVQQAGGEKSAQQMETALQQAGDKITLSLLDLIYGFKGRSALVLRLDDTQTQRLPVNPSGLTIPQLSFLICIEGIAPVVEKALAPLPMLQRTDEESRHVYTLKEKLPIPGLQPVLVADGNTLYLASTQEFFTECRTTAKGLGQTPEFQKALDLVGAESNGISYVSPQFFTALRRVPTLNPALPAEMKNMVDSVLAQVPEAKHPYITSRINLPEGILVKSSWNRSLKQDVALLSVYNPVTIGLFAAMAVPAFQKVRNASQEKAILNNLRMLSAAADQYYLETGRTTATYADLVGPTRYIKALHSVAGENYRTIRFTSGQPLRVTIPGGQTVQYP